MLWNCSGVKEGAALNHQNVDSSELLSWEKSDSRKAMLCRILIQKKWQ